MSEHTFGWSRRTLLRYGALGSVAGLAGCQGDDDDDEPPTDDELPGLFELAGTGADSYREWLVPDNYVEVGEQELLFQYNDFEAAAQENWENMQQRREGIATSFGTDTQDHEGNVIIGHPSRGTGFLYLGSFDRDSIVEFLANEGNDVTDEYGEYTVFNEQVAVGSDGIVGTPDYEQYIDAKNGDGERLAEADTNAGLLLDLLPGGIQTSVTRTDELEDVDVSGSVVTDVQETGDNERLVRTLVFHDAGDATVERAREILEEGGIGEIRTEERHGRVVMVDYTV